MPISPRLIPPERVFADVRPQPSVRLIPPKRVFADE